LPKHEGDIFGIEEAYHLRVQAKVDGHIEAILVTAPRSYLDALIASADVAGLRGEVHVKHRVGTAEVHAEDLARDRPSSATSAASGQKPTTSPPSLTDRAAPHVRALPRIVSRRSETGSERVPLHTIDTREEHRLGGDTHNESGLCVLDTFWRNDVFAVKYM
jgi:hypothetical protein